MPNAYLGFSTARGWSVLDEATFEYSRKLPGVWSFKTFHFGKHWNKSDELHVVVHGVDRALLDDVSRRAVRFAREEALVQPDAAGVLRVDVEALAARLAGQAAPVAAASPTPAARTFEPELSRNLSPVAFPRSTGGKHWAAIDKVIGLLQDHCERLTVGGSVRRGEANPKDVELVVIPKPTLWPTLDMLVATGTFSKADYGGKPRWGQLYRGIDVDGVKVEIFTATRDTWGYIYWLRTGPGAAGQYVVSRLWDSQIRAQDGAIWYAPDWQRVKRGGKYTWISANRVQVSVKDERAFFGLLNMPYVEPSDRTEKVYRAALGAKGRTWGDPLPLLMSATDSAAGPVDLFSMSAEKLPQAPKSFVVQPKIDEEWAMNVAPGLTLSVADLLGESVAVLGIKGSGKTQTAAVLAEELLAAGVPMGIVDIAGEYYGLRERYPVLIAGAAVSATVDVEVKPGAAGALAEYSLRESQSLIFDVSEYSIDERMVAVESFFKRLWAVAGELRKPYVILLEEAHNYIPQRSGTPMKSLLIQIATEGRKRGLSIVMVSQRPARIDKDVLAQAGIKFLHRATLVNDLANYTASVPTVIMSPKEVKAAVYDFGPGEALALVGKTVERVQVRKRHTYHGGYTPGLDAIQRPMALAADDHSEKIAALRAMLAQPVGEMVGGEAARLLGRIRELEQMVAARDARIAELEDQLQGVRARLLDGIDDKDQLAAAERLLAPVSGIEAMLSDRADKAEARAVRKQERDAARLVGRVRAAVGKGWQKDMLALLARHKTMTRAQIINALSISPATFYTPSALLDTGIIRRTGRGDEAVYTFVAEERIKTQYPAVDAGTLLGQMLA